MAKQETPKHPIKKKDAPGVSLEKVVYRIQQMMDPNSSVTHNQWLEDRVGNKRQYDVVIRGQFGGRPVLGVIECKDHSRKKGPAAIEAFAKKTENLGANLRLMVSRKGFTEQALKLAKHEHIGCLSLLPEDPAQVGFSIGDMWYGVLRLWTNVRLVIHFTVARAPIATFDSNTVKWKGKPVVNWFLKELFTTYAEEAKEGEYTLQLKFDQQRNIEIEGQEYPVMGISCIATRVYKKKRKWVNWSGDALYDWHTGQFTIPPGGVIVGSAVETDLSEWPDFEGDIPGIESGSRPGFVRAVIYEVQKWDNSKDNEVPDLGSL
jgi:hypothetical protein